MTHLRASRNAGRVIARWYYIRSTYPLKGYPTAITTLWKDDIARVLKAPVPNHLSRIQRVTNPIPTAVAMEGA